MNIEVNKEDLWNVGNTLYEENGYLTISCDGGTCNIEKMILRTILKCYGDYEITDNFETEWTDEHGNTRIDVNYRTNLPYGIVEME